MTSRDGLSSLEESPWTKLYRVQDAELLRAGAVASMFAVANLDFVIDGESLEVKGRASDVEVRFNKRDARREGDPPEEWPLLGQNTWFVWNQVEGSVRMWLRKALRARRRHDQAWSGWRELCLSWRACDQISNELNDLGYGDDPPTVEVVCSWIRQVPIITWEQSLKEYDEQRESLLNGIFEVLDKQRE